MWTKESPKKEGYYWVRTKGALSGRDRVCPVHAYCSHKDGIVNTVFFDGENFAVDCGLFEEWFSKEIPMPDTVSHTKLLLVAAGYYSDYHLCGIYSTQEKAEYAKKLYDADEIEEYALDELPVHPKGMLLFSVSMKKDGDDSHVYQRDASEAEDADEWQPLGNPTERFEFHMWAKDEEHAIKIANERRVQLIANNLINISHEEWSAGEIKKVTIPDEEKMPASPINETCLCTYHKIGCVERGVRENNPLCKVHNG